MAMKAKLHLATALRNDKTYLKTWFFMLPFKVADITEDKSENILRLV